MISTYKSIIPPSFTLLSKSERFCHFGGLTAGLNKIYDKCSGPHFLESPLSQTEPSFPWFSDQMLLAHLLLVSLAFLSRKIVGLPNAFLR